MSTQHLKAVVSAVALIIFSCGSMANPLQKQANMFFGQLPDVMPGAEADTPELVALGEKLYMDPRLSVNDTQSCNSCHNVTNSGPGVDNTVFSPGAIEGKLGGRNAPTVWNAGFQLAQFWDGREPNLQAQAKGPILNPVEMAMPSAEAVVEKLSAIDEYQAMFKKAFGSDDALTYDNIAHAIAAFERTLITKDRFDQFQAGDADALTKEEQAGLEAFVGNGCVACHSGPALGGTMYQKMGLVNAYANQEDLGRFVVTGNEADKMVFKVPMLRDVARTAPYFHDGSAATLEEAVKQMAWLQLGKKLDDKTVANIVAFLEALTHQG